MQNTLVTFDTVFTTELESFKRHEVFDLRGAPSLDNFRVPFLQKKFGRNLRASGVVARGLGATAPLVKCCRKIRQFSTRVGKF